jgi:hypothetical protein
VGCEHPMSSRKNRISNIRVVFPTHGRTKMTETERDIHKFPNLGLFNRRDPPHGTVRCRQCAAQSETRSTLKGLLENAAHSLTSSLSPLLRLWRSFCFLYPPFHMALDRISLSSTLFLPTLATIFVTHTFSVRTLRPTVDDLQGLVEVGSLPTITENVPRNMYSSEASRPRHFTREPMRQ